MGGRWFNVCGVLGRVVGWKTPTKRIMTTVLLKLPTVTVLVEKMSWFCIASDKRLNAMEKRHLGWECCMRNFVGVEKSNVDTECFFSFNVIMCWVLMICL